MLNADFDGDVLNTLASELPEVTEIFRNFSPTQMIYNRIDGSIKLDCSALENISISIFSDL